MLDFSFFYGPLYICNPSDVKRKMFTGLFIVQKKGKLIYWIILSHVVLLYVDVSFIIYPSNLLGFMLI
jgi:hypothetical protein